MSIFLRPALEPTEFHLLDFSPPKLFTRIRNAVSSRLQPRMVEKFSSRFPFFRHPIKHRPNEVQKTLYIRRSFQPVLETNRLNV